MFQETLSGVSRVYEGNGPAPQKEELKSGQLTMGDVYRLLVERLDRQLEIMDSRFDRQLRQLRQSFSVFSVIRWLLRKRPVLIPRQDKVSLSRAARGYGSSRGERRSRRR